MLQVWAVELELPLSEIKTEEIYCKKQVGKSETLRITPMQLAEYLSS